MKLIDLFESKVLTQHAFLEYNWKKDLADEEDENYLPSGYDYSKVLEISKIAVLKPEYQGKGYGAEIIKKFLKTPTAKKAELVFLDISPLEGYVQPTTAEDEERVMDKLEAAYKKLGFRNRHKHARMWLVLKGSIPDNELPT